MTYWVTKITQQKGQDAMVKAKDDFATIAHQMGYEYLNILRYDASDESLPQLFGRIDGITAGVQENDTILYQYPTYNGNQFEMTFVDRTIPRGIKVVLFVHDYEHLRYGVNPGFDEIEHLNKVNLLVVPTARMREQMRLDGVKTPIVLQYCWDYLTDEPLPTELPARQVMIAGTFLKSNLLSSWQEEIPLIAFGPNSTDQVPAPNVDYRGGFAYDDLVKILPNCFGLAWDTGEHFGNYTRYNNPFKVAMYLALGRPVIVWRKAAIAKLITENGLGYAVDSLEEIAPILAEITDLELAELQQRVRKFSTLLRHGYFGRRLLVEVEQQLADNNLII